MIRAKCDHRTGILGAAATAAIFAILAATTAAAQSGATVTGVHGPEEFCKTMIRQVAVLGQSAKADIFDMTQPFNIYTHSMMRTGTGNCSGATGRKRQIKVRRVGTLWFRIAHVD